MAPNRQMLRANTASPFVRSSLATECHNISAKANRVLAVLAMELIKPPKGLVAGAAGKVYKVRPFRLITASEIGGMSLLTKKRCLGLGDVVLSAPVLVGIIGVNRREWAAGFQNW